MRRILAAGKRLLDAWLPGSSRQAVAVESKRSGSKGTLELDAESKRGMSQRVAERLPSVILRLIYAHLDGRDLACADRACKAWRCDDSLWRGAFLRDFGDSTLHHLAYAPSPSTPFRARYQRRMATEHNIRRGRFREHVCEIAALPVDDDAGPNLISALHDGTGLVFAIDDTVYVVDGRSHAVRCALGPHPSTVRQSNYSPPAAAGGPPLVAAAFGHTVRLWDGDTGERLRDFELGERGDDEAKGGHRFMVEDLALDDARGLLVLLSTEPRLHLFSLRSGQPLADVAVPPCEEMHADWARCRVFLNLGGRAYRTVWIRAAADKQRSAIALTMDPTTFMEPGTELGLCDTPMLFAENAFAGAPVRSLLMCESERRRDFVVWDADRERPAWYVPPPRGEPRSSEWEFEMLTARRGLMQFLLFDPLRNRGLVYECRAEHLAEYAALHDAAARDEPPSRETKRSAAASISADGSDSQQRPPPPPLARRYAPPPVAVIQKRAGLRDLFKRSSSDDDDDQRVRTSPHVIDGGGRIVFVAQAERQERDPDRPGRHLAMTLLHVLDFTPPP